MSELTQASGALAVTAGNVVPPLRLGVIGCELGRTRYGAALVALPTFKISALTDPDETYARVWAREIGGKTPVYTNAADLLSQPLDAVLVASPLNERAQRIADTLRAGLPVLAEVPFAGVLTTADELLALSAQHQTLLMPALPRRFDPYFQFLAQQLEAGIIGATQQIRCAWSFPVESVEQTDDIVTGGWNAVLQTLACQTVDCCRWWQGAGTSVSADITINAASPAPAPSTRKDCSRWTRPPTRIPRPTTPLQMIITAA